MNALMTERPGQQVATSGETSVAAVAAQAKALVEARYTMAHYNPRDWDVVRQKLMEECRRPSFADNPSTYYKKPIGKGVEGLGIRFAEAALRCMKNVLTDTITVYEDDLKRILRVYVTDLESNISFTKDVTITKTVERSKPMDDGSYLSKRINSQNKTTYTVPATDDDLLNKEGALISKAIRTLALRLIPGDFQDEAEEIILRTRKDRAARDPSETRKKLVDSFSSIGISAEHIAEYLGHPIAETTPDELVDLRGLFGSLREGETSWRAVMENKAEREGMVDKNTGEVVMPRGKSDGAKKAAQSQPAPPPVEAESAVEDDVRSNPVPKDKQSGSNKTATPAQVALMRAKIGAQDRLDEAELCMRYECSKLEELPASLVNSVLATLEGK